MIPVHCCCEPEKRLGWLNAPSDRRAVAFMRDGDIQHAQIRQLQLIAWPVTFYQCAVGTWHRTEPVYRRFRAIDSHDHPIEWWRGVAGFVEAAQ